MKSPSNTDIEDWILDAEMCLRLSESLGTCTPENQRKIIHSLRSYSSTHDANMAPANILPVLHEVLELRSEVRRLRKGTNGVTK